MKSVLNVEVSAFKNYRTPTDPQTVNLLNWLTSPKYRQQVEMIRQEPSRELISSLKAELPAITPSGIFSQRCEDGLLNHSGMIQIDIDFKENSRIINFISLKEELCKIKNVAYCGLSVSGAGYFLIIPIANPDKHKLHFDYMYAWFKQQGINVDSKPRNVSSLRGYSYDSNAYFNHDAIVLVEFSKPMTNFKMVCNPTPGDIIRGQVENMIQAIVNRNIDIAPTYNDWLKIAFAFAHEFGESGRIYFHQISQFNKSYRVTTADRQYTNCLKSDGNGITIKTFFYLSKVSGLIMK